MKKTISMDPTRCFVKGDVIWLWVADEKDYRLNYRTTLSVNTICTLEELLPLVVLGIGKCGSVCSGREVVTGVWSQHDRTAHIETVQIAVMRQSSY